jgi:hypothetical protein
LQPDPKDFEKLTFDYTKPPAMDQRRLTKINSVDRDMVVMLHNYTGREEPNNVSKNIHTDNGRSKDASYGLELKLKLEGGRSEKYVRKKAKTREVTGEFRIENFSRRLKESRFNSLFF